MDPRFAVLKIFLIFRVYISSCFNFFPNFKNFFDNTVMIHNLPTIRLTIQQKVRKKKRTVLILIFSTISQKSRSWNNIYISILCLQTWRSFLTRIIWNKMWSLKGLAMLKCESRTSLLAVQRKWQPGSVLMFCSYHFKNG